MTRLLVIVNHIESQPGLLTQWMISENIEFDLRIGGVSRLPEPSALSDYDGLIMLGGGYMPDETDRAPWLDARGATVTACVGNGPAAVRHLPGRAAHRTRHRRRCAGTDRRAREGVHLDRYDRGREPGPSVLRDREVCFLR